MASCDLFSIFYFYIRQNGLAPDIEYEVWCMFVEIIKSSYELLFPNKYLDGSFFSRS